MLHLVLIQHFRDLLKPQLTVVGIPWQPCQQQPLEAHYPAGTSHYACFTMWKGITQTHNQNTIIITSSAFQRERDTVREEQQPYRDTHRLLLSDLGIAG